VLSSFIVPQPMTVMRSVLALGAVAYMTVTVFASVMYMSGFDELPGAGVA
jgi:hypothetical protein